MNKLSVLVLDDEAAYREGLSELLSIRGHRLQTASKPTEALELLKTQSFDLLLLDLSMPEMDGLELLQKIKSDLAYMDVIVVTGHADLEHSVAALRAGATDFITKPFSSLDIEHAIERSRKYSEIAKRLLDAEKGIAALSADLSNFIGTQIVGKSEAIRTVLEQMKKVSISDDTSVLIFGESGTGKELVARGIHGMSKRKGQYFHSVNCAAVPDTLFESEFFGYQKGAFTGAQETLPGWFEISNKGTLFLDEISGLPMQLQSKLLRVLDQKSIIKLGSHKEIMLNLRIITATNQNLEHMIAEGRFRTDLYHRFATFKIFLPPLRERREDIPLLVDHFIEHFNHKMVCQIKAIEISAIEALMQYYFPGNIRELKNMIERAFILSDGRRIKLKDLSIPGHGIATAAKASAAHSLNLDALEKDSITEALQRAKNNKTHTAELLGITRQSLERRMEKFGMK
ncbi:MAG: sigma-54 dependent transcriptional regulator [Bacteroidota bacterium]